MNSHACGDDRSDCNAARAGVALAAVGAVASKVSDCAPQWRQTFVGGGTAFPLAAPSSTSGPSWWVQFAPSQYLARPPPSGSG